MQSPNQVCTTLLPLECHHSLLQLSPYSAFSAVNSSPSSSCHVDSSFLVSSLVSSCSTSRALNQTHYCRTRSCTIDANTRGVNAYIPLLNFARQFALQREFSARELVTCCKWRGIHLRKTSKIPLLWGRERRMSLALKTYCCPTSD